MNLPQMNLSPMNLSPINILYFLYYKKSFFLYNDFTRKQKKINFTYNYNPVNKYIINKIMNK